MADPLSLLGAAAAAAQFAGITWSNYNESLSKKKQSPSRRKKSEQNSNIVVRDSMRTDWLLTLPLSGNLVTLQRQTQAVNGSNFAGETNKKKRDWGVFLRLRTSLIFDLVEWKCSLHQ